MEKLIILVVVIVGIKILVENLTKKNRPSKKRPNKINSFPYIKNKSLFTPAERAFLGVLTLAVNNQYRIFGKVRVADVVSVKKMPDKSLWQKAFNLISAKHFDFVICENDTLKICAVIELDDKSHQAKKRQERDAFLVGVCKASKLPLIQVPAKASYNVSEIQEIIQSAINIKPDNNKKIPDAPKWMQKDKEDLSNIKNDDSRWMPDNN